MLPGDEQEDLGLGITLAISEDGNTVVAGPVRHDLTLRLEGAVHVFRCVDGIWTVEAELGSPAPSGEGSFGFWGVAISGEMIAVGDLGGPANGFFPAVDIFRRVDGNWRLSRVIELRDDFDFSPTGVALSGGTLVVANAGANGGFGAAYVFGQAEGDWVLQSKLAPADLTDEAAFGASVAVSGSVVTIGAPGATDAGAAYVFAQRDGNWLQVAKLTGRAAVQRPSVMRRPEQCRISRTRAWPIEWRC